MSEAHAEIGGQIWLIKAIPLPMDKMLIRSWVDAHVDAICQTINRDGKFVPSVMLLASHPEAPNHTLQLGTGIWKFLAPSANTPELLKNLRTVIEAGIFNTNAEVICLSIPDFVAENQEAFDRLDAAMKADGTLNQELFLDDDEVYEVIYYTTETPTSFSARMFVVDRDENNRAGIACELEPNEFQLSLLPRYMKGT